MMTNLSKGRTNTVPHIIGISGNMGSGKSTLSKALSQALEATLISWDEFDDISIHPEDYVAWYHKGQDYGAWNYQELANCLRQLKSKKEVSHPVFKTVLNPTEFIIFDAPLGRLHTQTGTYIDTWVHLDVPLDVSLCRWLIRDYKNSDRTKDDLLTEIEFYLTTSRPLFIDDEMQQKADLVVNGMLTVDEEVKDVLRCVNGKR